MVVHLGGVPQSVAEAVDSLVASAVFARAAPTISADSLAFASFAKEMRLAWLMWETETPLMIDAADRFGVSFPMNISTLIIRAALGRALNLAYSVGDDAAEMRAKLLRRGVDPSTMLKLRRRSTDN